MNALSWEEVAARRDEFIGGQIEIRQSERMYADVVLRAGITAIEIENDEFVVHITWMMVRRQNEGWIAITRLRPDEPRALKTLMDASVVPVSERNDGTIEWSFTGISPTRLIPPGHRDLIPVPEPDTPLPAA